MVWDARLNTKIIVGSSLHRSTNQNICSFQFIPFNASEAKPIPHWESILAIHVGRLQAALTLTVTRDKQLERIESYEFRRSNHWQSPLISPSYKLPPTTTKNWFPCWRCVEITANAIQRKLSQMGEWVSIQKKRNNPKSNASMESVADYYCYYWNRIK